LPMGFSYSTLIAQAVHMYLLSQALPLDKCLHEDSTEFSLTKFRWLAYIDDLCMFCPSARQLRKYQQRVKKIYRRHGLAAKPSKEVLPTLDPVSVLGIEFEGRSCSFGLGMAKLLALCKVTERFVMSSKCTPQALSRLLGSWAWAILVRRPLFSVLRAAYVFVHKVTEPSPLWPSVRTELRMLVDLSPLLRVSLWQPPSPLVLATDASSSGLGITAAYSSMSSIRLFADHACGRRRLLSHQASLSAELVSKLRFFTMVSAKWHRPNHINVLEMCVVYMAISRLASSPRHRGTCPVLLTDSTVCLFSLQKGRSSSFPLLKLLRRIAVVVLWSNLRPAFSYIASGCNPADEPSRQ